VIKSHDLRQREAQDLVTTTKGGGKCLTVSSQSLPADMVDRFPVSSVEQDRLRSWRATCSRSIVFFTRLFRFPMIVVALVLVVGTNRGLAQIPGCTPEEARAGPPRHILRCSGGFSLEFEDATRLRVLPRKGKEPPEAVELDDGGILVDDPKALHRGFQILTPQAVASVRGTSWIVDVAGPRTSVFVIRGKVEVSRRGASSVVTLAPGDGVDVESGGAPLLRKRWAPARAAALLARFGR
jgi:ferric-dicitrate binding protein FerR (iron transport regulator)